MLVALTLPDRCLALDAVDDLACTGEGFLAMGRGGGDDHARLAQRHRAGAVLGRRRAQTVGAHRFLQDRRDPLFGHLDVGLVLERGHLARDALKRHHRARPGVADRRRHRVEAQGLLAHVHVRLRAAAERGDQGQLVAALQHGLLGRVVAVHGHLHRQAAQGLGQLGYLGKRRERIRDRGSTLELELDAVAPGPFP